MTGVLKPILCLDFDGVIHSYTSGWQGPTKMTEPRAYTAAEIIAEMAKQQYCRDEYLEYPNAGVDRIWEIARKGVHQGDCTNAPCTCVICMVKDFEDNARAAYLVSLRMSRVPTEAQRIAGHDELRPELTKEWHVDTGFIWAAMNDARIAEIKAEQVGKTLCPAGRI